MEPGVLKGNPIYGVEPGVFKYNPIYGVDPGVLRGNPKDMEWNLEHLRIILDVEWNLVT